MSITDPIEPEVSDEPLAAAPDPVDNIEPVEAMAPDPVLERLDQLTAQVAEGQRLIARQTEVAASLHAENQELRAGELRRAQQSLVFGVLGVYDDVRRMASIAGDDAGRRDLELVADALADTLERNGVEVTQVECGTPFDPRRHKVERVEPSADADADRTVAEVVRPGFEWSDGEAIRAAQVVVYKHAPATTPEAAAAPELAQPAS